VVSEVICSSFNGIISAMVFGGPPSGIKECLPEMLHQRISHGQINPTRNSLRDTRIFLAPKDSFTLKQTTTFRVTLAESGEFRFSRRSAVEFPVSVILVSLYARKSLSDP